MSKYAQTRHKRAARMLGYCLTLDSVDAWWGFADVIAKRLTVKERTALAFMALNSLPPEDAALAADAAMHAQAGEVAA